MAVSASRESEWGVARDGASPHPDFLSFGDGPPECVRVDHPVLRPLFFGLPTVGWSGDARLSVYSRPRTSTFLLVRLENDGEYRLTKEIKTARPLSEQSIGELCRWLVERDSRRGFDAAAWVDAHNARMDAEREAAEAEWRADKSDKLAFALRKDLGVPRFDHAIGEVPWHEKAAVEGDS